MEKQNVTLAVPKDLLREAKLLAVKRETSLSGLLTQALIDIVQQDATYQRARERNLYWLDKGLELNTMGQISWSREELHER